MILAWAAAGIAAGIIAGLIPGLHSNNVSALVAISPIAGMEATAFMLSMGIAQAFSEIIPSVFIGAPSENTFEAVLPGHLLMREGKATEAIMHSIFGGIVAVVCGALLTPLFFAFLEQNSELILQSTPPILAAALLIFILEEKTPHKKVWVIFVIISAAAQGILFKGQIFALITGYFGVAGILASLKDKPNKTVQETKVEIKKESAVDALVGLGGGALVSLMPGIGSNTAAGIINTMRSRGGAQNYLSMLGAINLSNFFFSFATLIALGKARNGSMLALQEKIFSTPMTLYYGTVLMLFAAGVSAIITLLAAKKAASIVSEKNSRVLAIFAMALMIAVVALMGGAAGITALFFSTALGLLVAQKGVRRSTMMASLIVPVLFFYIFVLY